MCTWSIGSSGLPRCRPRAKNMTVCMRASELRVGSSVGAVLSCFLSLLVFKSGSPPVAVVFASQLFAQKDRRPYSQEVGSA